jgi:putative spermidine/putrescine transport system permease protein
MLISVKKKNRIFAAILTVLPLLAVVLAFEVIPLFKLLISSFQPDVKTMAGFSFDNYIEVLTSHDSLLAFRNSILIAVLSTAIGLVIAYAAIRAVRKSTARTRKRVTALFSVVSNFSGIPLAFSFMLL